MVGFFLTGNVCWIPCSEVRSKCRDSIINGIKCEATDEDTMPLRWPMVMTQLDRLPDEHGHEEASSIQCSSCSPKKLAEIDAGHEVGDGNGRDDASLTIDEVQEAPSEIIVEEKAELPQPPKEGKKKKVKKSKAATGFLELIVS